MNGLAYRVLAWSTNQPEPTVVFVSENEDAMQH